MSEYKSYVLWGSSGHAKVLADIIRLRGGSVVALFDNNPESVSCLPEVPLFRGVVGFSEWLASQASLADTCAALAIGGTSGSDRHDIAQKFKTAGLSLPSLIHPCAAVAESAQLGDGCQILSHAVVAVDVSMGHVCIVNTSASVDHECRLGIGVHIAPGAVLCGCVSVGDNVMIGAGAVVLPRVCIGDGALIGAGAVVTRDVPAGAVVVGNPAKIVRN